MKRSPYGGRKRRAPQATTTQKPSGRLSSWHASSHTAHARIQHWHYGTKGSGDHARHLHRETTLLWAASKMYRKAPRQCAHHDVVHGPFLRSSKQQTPAGLAQQSIAFPLIGI